MPKLRHRTIVADHERALQALREREIQAVRARDEFLAIASHELRTPATSISLAVEGLTRLIQRGSMRGEDEVFLEFIRTCERQSRHLRSLIDRFLDLGRAQEGPLHLDFEEIDLASLVREFVSSMQEQLVRAGCVTTVLADAPAVGCWDRSRLYEVFGNLLSNASKYGAGQPIRVVVESSGDRVQVSVRDRGIGIAPEQREKIFGKFERAVPSGSYGGLGLGLYIAAEIVRAHAGEIRVESEVGVGSTFTVELPLDPRSARNHGLARKGEES